MSSVVHHQFTVAQYDHLIDRGFLGENEPVELIRGEILRRMPIGSSHIAAVNRLTQLFVTHLSSRVQVSIQNPVVFDDSEPEPDVALLDPRDDFYASAKPQAADVRLLIEVADSSLEFDRTEKLSIYAEGGIVDYWIVNLMDSTIEVHRDQQSDGRYASQAILSGSQIVRPLAFADLELSVTEILGN